MAGGFAYGQRLEGTGGEIWYRCKYHGLMILSCLFLLTLSIHAQTPSATPSTAGPAATPIFEPTPSSAAVPSSTATPAAIPTATSVAPPAAPTKMPSDPYFLQSPLTYQKLFAVGASGSYTAEERSFVLARRLEKVLQDGEGTAPFLSLREVAGNVLILADGKVLATVLAEDVLATSPGIEVRPSDILATAEIWREKLKRDFAEGVALQSPYYSRIAIALVILLFFLCLILHKKIGQTQLNTAIPRWLVQLCMWSFFAVLSLWAFPASRRWALKVHETAFLPLFRLVEVIVVVSVVVHFFEKLTVKYFESLLENEPNIFSRKTRRISTLQQVTLVTGRLFLILLASGIYLSLLPLNFAPILASAGVLSVAFGFAAQDTLKDLFGGLSILVEDRFGVGDWIEWNGYSGSVEGFNLKSTRLRKVDGSLVIIPNGDLRVVSNLSNEWSQVDYSVGISYETDFKFALACLTEEAERLSEEWPDRVLGRPDVKGLEKLGESSVTLRVFLRTQPLAQWDVHREMNSRVKTRFDREGISIPYPQRTVWLKEEAKESLPTDPARGQ